MLKVALKKIVRKLSIVSNSLSLPSSTFNSSCPASSLKSFLIVQSSSMIYLSVHSLPVLNCVFYSTFSYIRTYISVLYTALSFCPNLIEYWCPNMSCLILFSPNLSPGHCPILSPCPRPNLSPKSLSYSIFMSMSFSVCISPSSSTMSLSYSVFVSVSYSVSISPSSASMSSSTCESAGFSYALSRGFTTTPSQTLISLDRIGYN